MPFAATDALLDGKPGKNSAIIPSGALEGLQYLGAGAWHFLLVDIIGLPRIQPFAQQRGAGTHALERRRGIIFQIARHRGAAQLDLPLTSRDMLGHERQPVFRHRGHDVVAERRFPFLGRGRCGGILPIE